MLTIDAIALTEAVAKISSKTPIGSVLTSAEWQDVPLELRETAQFSARVESARVLQTIQDRMAGALKLERENLATGKTATFDRSNFIDAVRSIAREEGLSPPDESLRGGIQDITSIPRLGLIFDMQQSRAQEFARWKMDQTEGALELYPAQEFVRIEDRRVPRLDWPDRWVAAGGTLYSGRMIALKNDPVWEKLSIFGTPWPPFDWGSGMGLEDIARDEAITLGVMDPDQTIDPSEGRFTDQMQASAQGLEPETLAELKRAFGDQVVIEGDSIRWAAAE